jgi:imidazolonepropionase-like amidohydrolase
MALLSSDGGGFRAHGARAIGTVLLALMVASCSRTTSSVVALTGGTLYDGTGDAPRTDAVVLIDGATIRCVGSREDCPVPSGATIEDLAGRVILPGLVDAHVHVGQTGWLDGRPGAIDLRARYPYDSVTFMLRDNPNRFYRSWICAGVTAAYDVGGMGWTVTQARRDATRPDAPHMEAAGPLVSHAGLPSLSIPGDSTFIVLTSPEAGVAGVRKLKAMDAAAVKVWLLAPPDSQWPEIQARFRAVAAEAKAHELPLIMHATSMREAREAMRARPHMLVHSVEDTLVDPAFVQELVAAGTIYVPTLVVGNNWITAIEAAVSATAPAISDPLGCVDEGLKARIAEISALQALIPNSAALAPRVKGRREQVAVEESRMAENLRRVHAAGVTVAVGTDAGNPLTLHGAAMLDELAAMERAGVHPESLLVMATRNGARAMRRTDFGSLAPGMSADLLVLGADPDQGMASGIASLQRVMLKGQWVPGR